MNGSVAGKCPLVGLQLKRSLCKNMWGVEKAQDYDLLALLFIYCFYSKLSNRPAHSVVHTSSPLLHNHIFT